MTIHQQALIAALTFAERNAANKELWKLFMGLAKQLWDKSHLKGGMPCEQE